MVIVGRPGETVVITQHIIGLITHQEHPDRPPHPLLLIQILHSATFDPYIKFN